MSVTLLLRIIVLLLVLYSLPLLFVQFLLQSSGIFFLIKSFKNASRSSSCFWRLLVIHISSLDQLIYSLCRLLQFFEFNCTLFNFHFKSLLGQSELMLGRGAVTSLLSIFNTLLLHESNCFFLSELVETSLVRRLLHHQGVVVF